MSRENIFCFWHERTITVFICGHFIFNKFILRINHIMIKIKVFRPQAKVTLTEVGYPY